MIEQKLEQKLSVLIVATDNEQRALMKALLDGTKVVRSVDACENFPVAETIRAVQDWLALTETITVLQNVADSRPGRRSSTTLATDRLGTSAS
jgi:hypothetical protein